MLNTRNDRRDHRNTCCDGFLIASFNVPKACLRPDEWLSPFEKQGETPIKLATSNE